MYWNVNVEDDMPPEYGKVYDAMPAKRKQDIELWAQFNLVPLAEHETMRRHSALLHALNESIDVNCTDVELRACMIALGYVPRWTAYDDWRWDLKVRRD